jgi:hypothetical protein
MPETKDIDGAFMSAKLIESNKQYNNGNIAAGLAYNIELGDNGVWGDDSDSLINAHTQTSWRRRICYSTVANRDSSCTKLGVQSTNAIEEARRNDAYLAWGDRWDEGKITNYSLTTSAEGNCYVSFMDENNVEMTYDYYAYDESAGKVMDGPIGFYSFWSGDGKERGYMTVEILELTADAGESEEPEAPTESTITIVPNADNWINGHNYRLETTNADSYAKIEDGKLVLKLNVGDVFWIPTLTVKDTSSAFTFENMTTDTAWRGMRFTSIITRGTEPRFRTITSTPFMRST